MATGYVGFDSSAAAGSKFPSPDVRAEIEGMATGDPGPGGVTTSRLADNAVTTPKINAGAVTSTKIATGGVATANVADGAIATAKLADGSVTAAKAGTGMMTAFDNAGNPVAIKAVHLTAAQYAALATKDPNTYYFVSA